MKKHLLICLLAMICTSCTTIPRVASLLQGDRASQTSSIAPEPPSPFSEKTDVRRGDFSLRDNGKEHVRLFLRSVKLGELASLKTAGGSEEMTKSLCEFLYLRYTMIARPAEPVGERCRWNVAKNREKYLPGSAPISVRIAQLGDYHLLLLVEESGRGGATLFSAVYDMRTQVPRTLDLHPIGPSDIHYVDPALYFLSPDAHLQILAAYDLEKQEMVQPSAIGTRDVRAPQTK